jgi:4-hydroxybenzoate polyprenyltransferase
MSGGVKDWLRLIRPEQWTKNLFVFAAIVFSHHLSDTAALLRVAAAFGVFCLLSSGVYVLNDLKDRDADRNHPRKKNRPLATGTINPVAAWTVFVVLTGAGFAGSAFLGPGMLVVSTTYFALMAGYTYGLKHVAILDVMVIAAGFVLRAVAGGVVIGVAVSPWLLICTFLLSLFLALGKRRHELILLGPEGAGHRASLSSYSAPFLDQMISVVTASALVSYALYTLAPDTVRKFGTTDLLFTIPFVLFGIFRYLYVLYHRGEGGSPERVLLSDAPFIMNLALWLAVVIWVIYRAVPAA